jgi:hypothetical protein
MRRRQNRQRDRKVVPGPLLAQPGRRQIDRDPPIRPLELGARDARTYALLRFLAGLVGQAHNGERGHASLEVSLNLDPPRLETDEGMGDGAREHHSTLRPTDAHMGREIVPTLV